jgi:putative two-component system response regulator
MAFAVRPGAAAWENSSDQTEGVLVALAQAVEQRDQHTANHCERLALIGVTMGMSMDLPFADLLTLFRGGYLHDVGKVSVPDSILCKPGRLTEEEWAVMRTHPARGEEICKPLPSLRAVLPIIRSHHERWDGGGYPDGLRGEQIPLLARIAQMGDIYDALTSPRSYKPALTPDQALEVMVQETDRGWRDPDLMALFLRLHRDLISRIAAYHDNAELALDRMRRSLLNLQQMVDVNAPAAAAVTTAAE